jgi:hypothetical protein
MHPENTEGEPDMKRNLLKYFEKLTDMLAASAFAELGELETAREIILCSPSWRVSHAP